MKLLIWTTGFSCWSIQPILAQWSISIPLKTSQNRSFSNSSGVIEMERWKSMFFILKQTNKPKGQQQKYFDFIFPCRLELYGVIVGWYEIYECHSVEWKCLVLAAKIISTPSSFSRTRKQYASNIKNEKLKLCKSENKNLIDL